MKKVIILQHENWFIFSPSEHENYSRYDEMKVHGFKNLIEAMQKLNCMVSSLYGYSINSPMRTPKEINEVLKRLKHVR